MYHHPWATTLLIRYMVQPLGSENQGNIWACLGCSLWSYGGLWGDPPLLYVVHDSYDTHKTVGYHTHTCVIILGSLHYWWGAWSNLLVPISRVTASYVWGVVCGHAVVCGVFHPCQTWYMSHITWGNLLHDPGYIYLVCTNSVYLSIILYVHEKYVLHRNSSTPLICCDRGLQNFSPTRLRHWSCHLSRSTRN